jgi:hypothetical protein
MHTSDIDFYNLIFPSLAEHWPPLSVGFLPGVFAAIRRHQGPAADNWVVYLRFLVAISDVIPLFGPGKLEIPASDLSGSNSKYRIERIRDLKEMSHKILKALFADSKQTIGPDEAFFCHFIEMIDVESMSSVKRSVAGPSSCVSAIMRLLFEIYDIQSRILDWSGPSDEIMREIQYLGCPTSGVAQRTMRKAAPHARGVSKARQGKITLRRSAAVKTR